jgi:prepilin-type N-terminal cleavage/methylation domain-containing protein
MKSTGKAFTLLELIVVITIIAIAATFAMPLFRNARERALDREVITGLNMIAEAQKAYSIEHGYYAGSSDPQACPDTLDCITNVTTTVLNEKLKLNLPTDRNPLPPPSRIGHANWHYLCAATPTCFICSAARLLNAPGLALDPYTRVWQVKSPECTDATRYPVGTQSLGGTPCCCDTFTACQRLQPDRGCSIRGQDNDLCRGVTASGK